MLAKNKAQGNTLLAKYHGMQDGRFPLGTTSFDEYVFALRMKGESMVPLTISWLDYPGKWWIQEPVDQEERDQQKEALKKLLRSQVGLLIFYGACVRSDGESYMRKVL